MLRSIGQNPTEDEILNLVIEYDVNGDGTIDFDEFLEMMSKQTKDVDQVRSCFLIATERVNWGGRLRKQELDKHSNESADLVSPFSSRPPRSARRSRSSTATVTASSTPRSSSPS